ncbi:MAG: YkgJ family cysteine cluster protein [Thermoproteota archaeon]
MSIDEIPIAREKTLFKCKLCGEKCCSLNPEVFEEDLERIRRVHPSFKPYYSSEGSMTLMGEGGFCPFLKNGLCTIHDLKPVLCTIYPFYPMAKDILERFLRLPDDVKVVKWDDHEYVFIMDDNCPGVGCGDPADFEKILENYFKIGSLAKSI